MQLIVAKLIKKALSGWWRNTHLAGILYLQHGAKTKKQMRMVSEVQFMSLQLLKAGTSDAVTLTGISKHAFDSDAFMGGPSAGGPPGYMSVSFHTKMARQGHLYKLTEERLIVGGAILFLQGDALNISRIFVAPEHFRKGYGSFMMQEIESMFAGVKEFTLDTPDWNVRTNAFYTKLGYTEIKRDSSLVYYSKRKVDEWRN